MEPLRWRNVDQYHALSKCGRFAVSRMNIEPRVWYIAWRRPRTESEAPVELGATSLPIDAEEFDRLTAINEMKALCSASEEPA